MSGFINVGKKKLTHPELEPFHMCRQCSKPSQDEKAFMRLKDGVSVTPRTPAKPRALTEVRGGEEYYLPH